MAQIRHSYYEDSDEGYFVTVGIEFLNKEGKSLLKVGNFDGRYTEVFEVEENEQVIGIKAQNDIYNPSPLLNLQFKIAKLI